MKLHWLKWTTISIAMLIAIIFIAAFIADEPLRQYIERSANDAVKGYVKGYHVRIGTLDSHPFTLSVDLRDVVVRREARPDPPLGEIQEIVINSQLAPLLAGKVAADIHLRHPVVFITRRHIEAASAKAKHAERSVPWQDQVRDMMPFEANLFVRDGEIRYAGQLSDEPIRMTELDVEAHNLTNRPADAQAYSSELRMSGRLAGHGRMEIEGRANPLAAPLPAVEASIKLSGIRVGDLMPIAGSYNLMLNSGMFNATGRVVQDKRTVLMLESFLLEDAMIGYVYQTATTSKQRRQLERGAKQAAKAYRAPSFLFKIGHGKILNSEVGFQNRSGDPDYRIFLADVNADVDNFSNRLEEGTGVVKITGKFMGSGPTVITATFRPETPRPDLDLAVKIIKTDVAALNDVLRAHGNVDTHRGKFALFSEIAVKDNRIDGYVKPLFQDVDVYDPEKDQDKAWSTQIYNAVIGGVTALLENDPRDEVATQSDLSGPVDNPKANTWEIIGKLVQNAFFNVILPGFEGGA
ncbi:MAG: hypothetical protein Nkreftii_002292 [Candidatus Nitrospira kreftii]|uniref:AsmA domain-containing protein n=1 Tax=Candidatus Nitrospira kreftii TaxID=2652173 RepID=A0A7S8IZR1_9BACT|nr:MAG: hypothetical protein Nkreftii_002292 [Candidatus Nitrospira kreftii]